MKTGSIKNSHWNWKTAKILW